MYKERRLLTSAVLYSLKNLSTVVILQRIWNPQRKFSSGSCA